ncbi:hypothetical protein [Larkinella humicola]|uniref:Uncharacterized protein n=1 Tax=Larkinella humicola TaxID=2607654 RepID=A0A5N1JJT6_9BACT|nr:hypothetical protein [Larkinella humicola]KAA9356715.1 hypothetical protein F0P93_02920 [Larkinella humicola]
MIEQRFKMIEIRYQTALVVPPPYAHFFTILLHPTSDGRLSINLTMTYTDREELDEEEITGEGFTTTDDYQWSGHLSAVWEQTVGDLARKVQLKAFDEEKLSDNQDYFLVTIDTHAQGSQSGTPSHRSEWQFLSQELIQAVYEVSGKEKPFEATYLEIESGSRTEAHLTASFAGREVRLETRRANQTQTKTLPWKELKALMEVFFAVDYNSEEALLDAPRKPGRYLNLGTPEWYETSTAIIGDEGAVGKLRKLLVRLSQP